MRRGVKRGVAAAVSLVGLAGAYLAYREYEYPYGWSHCCDKQLVFALLEYAERHDGWYPRGETTPEASLSLLYRQDPELADLLRGKTVPAAVVRGRLERGDLLTPETCGWHYVEGLRKDDPRLALLWDKAGLGHNGERNSDGGHTVWFVNTDSKYVPGARWGDFLAEQDRLRAGLKRPR